MAAQNQILVPRTFFKNGCPEYFRDIYGNIYKFSHVNADGNCWFTLAQPVVGSIRRKKKSPTPPPVLNRTCTGELTFIAENPCIAEQFEVSFTLNPLGELFNSVISPCDAMLHNRATFLCNQTEASIRTSLLASLQPQFVGKVDFTVTRTDGSGTGFNGIVHEIIEQPDGKLVIVGDFTTYNGISSERIIRLNPDFTIDTVALGTGFDLEVFSAVILGDGRIVVGGQFTTYNGTTSNSIIILNSDFTIDTVAVGTGFGAFNIVNDLALEADGTIVVGGDFTDYNGTSSNRVIKLDDTLNIDTTDVGTGFNNVVRTIEIQVDGDILLGGNFTSYDGTSSEGIIRLNSDLTIDTVADGTGFGVAPAINDIAIESNGDILVAGTFTDYNGSASNRIIRLEPVALVVDTVAVGTGFDAQTRTIKVESDGNIIIGGDFLNYNGTSSESIIRLDNTFNVETVAVGTGFDSGVFDVLLESDGKIVAGGQFTTYDGDSALRIIRLNEDFTPDVLANPIYTITVTHTDVSTSTEPTSLFGTVLENCVEIVSNQDMNLICTIS